MVHLSIVPITYSLWVGRGAPYMREATGLDRALLLIPGCLCCTVKLFTPELSWDDVFSIPLCVIFLFLAINSFLWGVVPAVAWRLLARLRRRRGMTEPIASDGRLKRWSSDCFVKLDCPSPLHAHRRPRRR